MARLRVGVVGAGGIVARLHLPDLAKNADFDVRLLAGRRESRLRLLCDRFDIPGWTRNYGDVVADSGIDAVIVGTPHPLHVEWGIAAVREGKHVLMQKPLCGDLEEADAFVAVVEKTDRTVLCMPHFGNHVYTLRELCREGVIGRVSGARCRTSHGGPEIYYAEIRDIFEETGDDLWFFDSKRASVGALFDMGVYAVSNLVGILGTVTRVTGMVSTFDKPTDLEDVATLVLHLADGGIATAETSWCDPARTWELSVHGTAGKFTVPGQGGAAATKWTPTSYTRESAPVHAEPVDCAQGVGGLHEHWLDCIRKGVQPPLEHVWLARHVTEVLLAGLESSRTGRAVELRSTADAPHSHAR
jgi:predicted dehydrogenase